jgi:hypothetical protein
MVNLNGYMFVYDYYNHTILIDVLTNEEAKKVENLILTGKGISEDSHVSL